MASTTVYAAACNPPRNARQSTHTRSRARSPSESSSASEYTPEPVRPPVGPVEPVNSSPGAKRGRKPAVLSRTAREAQRKLNHSIIEKARRTKINEALATLKQLVPANYGQIPQIDDADLDDGEYDGASKKKKAGGSARRRSSNWKSWNGRVDEGPSCASCSKRKRAIDEEDEERRAEKRHAQTLPSISSWLPSPENSSHLPSPPLSSRVPAQHAPAQLPPALSLGPATQGMTVQTLIHTPEEETAASLLLEMREVQTPATILGLVSRR
ncbi:BHLH domain-containing protein [Mycena kentingensis (nom. inval.)]|nr:BHLH domain-containing protein [Mycena kentingensis (nom. inval.)]